MFKKLNYRYARIFSSGFELNSTANGVEWDSQQGTATVSSSTFRSGSFAGRLQDGGGAGTRWEKRITAADVNGPWYARVYINVAVFGTTYASSNTILEFNNGAANLTARIRLDTTNKQLQLWDSAAQIGSNSATLSLSQWYRVEMYAFNNTGSGKLELTGYIDGVSFATTTTSTNVFGLQFMRLGEMSGTAGTGTDIFFDDVALNDNSGSFQIGLPGAGQIVHLKPNAAGDNNSFTVQVGGTVGSANNFTRVNEVPPDDATTYNADTVLNNVDDFNIDNTPSAIEVDDTINVVQVGVRYSALVAALESTFKARIKKVASGTISKSAAITPSSVTWVTNANSAPFTYPITLYQDPDSVDWTKQTLDTAQIGYEISTGNTNATAVSNIWLLVDSTPAVGDTYYPRLPLKPRIPYINWNHPITKGMFFDSPVFERGSTSTSEIITKGVGVITGATWLYDIFGTTLSFAGGAATDQIAYPTAVPSTLRSIEAIFLAKATDATARRIENWDNSDNIQLTSTNIIFSPNWSTTVGIFNMAVPSTNAWHNLIITYDGTLTTNVPVVYLDGVSITVSVGTAPVGTLNNSTGVLRVGNTSAGTRCWNGYIGLYRRWNRILNAQEAKQLYTNPWQIYAVPR